MIGVTSTWKRRVKFCSAVAVPGDAATIVTTTGGLTGAFDGFPDGDTFFFNSQPVEIVYTANDAILQFDTTPVINGSAVADHFLVRQDGTNIEVHLTVDYGHTGDFFDLPVIFNGGDPVLPAAAGDALYVDRGAALTIVHDMLGAASGNLDIDGNVDLLSYTDVEPVILTASVIADLTLNLPASADDGTLSDIDGAAAGTDLRFLSNDAPPTFARTDFSLPTNSITINGGDGNDLITVQAMPAAFPSLTISGQGNSDTVNFPADIIFAAGSNLTVDTTNNINVDATLALSGAGAAMLTAQRTIDVDGAAAAITSTAGSITLIADGTGGGNGYGIRVRGGAMLQSGTGNVTLIGNGLSPTNDDNNMGVRLESAGSSITSTSGDISITGTGAGDRNSNRGVFIEGDTTVTSAGDISITGTGGGGAGGAPADGDGNDGVEIDGTVETTGAGAISIMGTGGGDGTGDDNNVGVDLSNANSLVRTENGTISITGVGGGGNPLATDGSDNNDGIRLDNNGATIESTGSGTITLDGTGGKGDTSQRGVRIDTGAVITSSDGDISVTGLGGTGTGNAQEGIRIDGTISSTGTAATAANITLNGTGGTGVADQRGINFGNNAALLTTIDGDIMITGTGGAGTGDNSDGIQISSSGDKIRSTGTGADAGTITLVGTGGGNGNTNRGVEHTANAIITSIDGAISITGTGGGGLAVGGDTNVGVEIDGTISSTGSGANAATITIMGTGGTGGSGDDNNRGVDISNAVATIISADGSISITGIGGGGGSADSDNNDGIRVSSNGTTIESTGTAAIQLNGTGHADSRRASRGVRLDVDTLITSAAGPISITGQGGGTGAAGDDTNVGVEVDGTVRSTGAATIAIIGTGGGSGAAGDDGNRGVDVSNAAALITTTDGNITITGIGGGSGTTANPDNNDGVRLSSAGATISSTGNGQIIVGGTGGASSRTGNRGVLIAVDTVVTSATSVISITGQGGGTGAIGEDTNIGVEVDGTVSSSDSATITISGTGGGTGAAGDNENRGVDISNANALITTVDGNIMIAGVGGGSGTAADSDDNDGIRLTTALATISSTGDGQITLDGTGGATSRRNNRGVRVAAGTIIDSTTGAISITGLGGGTGAVGDDTNVGVEVDGSITSNGAATITISGTGGGSGAAGDDNNRGVDISNAVALVTTVDGDIMITGVGGGSGATVNSDNNDGVQITTGSDVTSTGLGTITIDGTGGPNAGDRGVDVEGAGTLITTFNGAVSITGLSGGDDGVRFDGSAAVTSTGTGALAGTITINGTGGSGNNDDGVQLETNVVVTSIDGDISITGTGANDDGVEINQGATVSSTGTGAEAANITIDGTGGSAVDNEGVNILATASAISTVDGDITITGIGDQGVNLTAGVTAPLTATGDGIIDICGESNGAGAGVQIDSPIASGTGNVLIASVDDVVFGANGDVASTSGDVNVNADKNGATNGGQITLANGTLIDGGTGDVDLEADGNITLGGLLTTGAASVDSLNGSILDGGDAHEDVSAATAVLTAAVNVGTGANFLDTQLSSLEAAATAGGVWIDNMGALSVGGIGAIVGLSAAGNVSLINNLDVTITELITSATGIVSIDSTAGSILDNGNTDQDVIAPSAVLTAANNVGTGADFLETQLNNLEGAATSGGFWVDNMTALTIGGIGATLGISTGGVIDITNNSSIAVTENVIGGGNVTLTTTDSGGTGDDLTLIDGVVVQSTGGNVDLSADENLELGTPVDSVANVAASAAGDVDISGSSTLAADWNAVGSFDQLTVTGGVDLGLDVVDLNLSLPFTPVVADSMTLIDNDTAGDAVVGTFSGQPEGSTLFGDDGVTTTPLEITYAGNDGNDVVISYDQTPIINGSAGPDHFLARVDAAGGFELHLTNGPGFGATITSTIILTPRASLLDLTINALADNDTLTVDYGFTGGFFDLPSFFNGDDPTAAPGDELHVDRGAFTTLVHNMTGADTGTLDIDGNIGLLTYTGLELADTTVSTAVDFTLNLPAVADNAQLSDPAGFLRLESTDAVVTFAQTDFGEPSGSIMINGGAGDTLTGSTALDIDADVTITAENVAFDSTLDGTMNLIVNASGTTAFSAVVGATTALTSVTTDAAGTTSISGSVTTSAVQTFNDAVTVGVDSTFTGTDISFVDTLDGGFNVVVVGSGATTFGGAVGGIAPLASLITDAVGTTAVNGGAVTTSAAQTFNDPVTVTTDATFTGTDIEFADSLDGAFNVIVNGSGTTTLGGAVGSATQLVSLTTDAAGNTGTIDTTDAQVYNDAVTVGVDSTLTSSNGPVTFVSTIDGPSVLIINNNSGITTFGDTVGGTTPLASLDVNTDGPFVLAVDVTTVGAIDVDVVSGNTTVNGGAQVTSNTAAITINAPSNVNLEPGTALSAGTNLTINGAGVFNIGGSLQHNGIGTITGSAGSDTFIIDNNAGTTFNGGTVENILSDISIDGVGGTDSLTVDDTGDATGDTVTVDLTSIAGLVDVGSAIDHAGIETMTFNLGSGDDSIDMSAFGPAPITDVVSITANGNLGDDTFDATTSTTTLVTSNGGSPVVPASPGDTLNITTVNIDLPIVFPASTDGQFTSSVNSVPNLPIDWTSIETFFFDGQEFQVGDLYVRGTDDADRIIFSASNRDTVLVRINNVFYGPFAGITGEIVAYGEGGNDRISISGNLNKQVEFHGGIGRDNLAGGRNDDTFFGDDENDIILTGEGNNTAFGGTGNDIISARAGNDTLIGQDGNDQLIGSSGSDVLIGDDLNDLLAIGNDQLVGGNGNDLLVGGSGNDILSGGFGDDVLVGNAGNDLLRGNQNEDLLLGGMDQDELRGEANSDVLIGGFSSLEYSESDLLSLLTNWPLSGLFTDLGTLTGDGDIDTLIGGGAADELHASPEDVAGVDANDILLPL